MEQRVQQQVDITIVGGGLVGAACALALQRQGLAVALVERQQVDIAVPDALLDDERRRYYRLTPKGRRVLSAEAARHLHLVELARAKQVLSRPRPA